jgi:hypothetical protein
MTYSWREVTELFHNDIITLIDEDGAFFGVEEEGAHFGFGSGRHNVAQYFGKLEDGSIG